jgi:GH15 family glucan-1,4-alpha-glucosidase
MASASGAATNHGASAIREHGGGYLPIENYGMIGNMRTCALVGIDGSVDFMCWYEPPPWSLAPTHAKPDLQQLVLDLCVLADARNRPEFDSPSLFCRLLDKNRGGFFSISPATTVSCTTKQQYLPSTNILQTRYIHEEGVVDLVDFFPRPKKAAVLTRGLKQSAFRETRSVQEELKRWLVRRVECVRGKLALGGFSIESLLYE